MGELGWLVGVGSIHQNKISKQLLYDTRQGQWVSLVRLWGGEGGGGGGADPHPTTQAILITSLNN